MKPRTPFSYRVPGFPHRILGFSRRILAALAMLLGMLLVAGGVEAKPTAQSRLDEVMDQRLRTEETYRLTRLSDSVVFATLASAKARMSVLGGVGPGVGVGPWSGPALSLTNSALEWTLDHSDSLSEEEAQMQQDLIEMGFIPTEGKEQILITLVESERSDQLLDFSNSERLEANQEEQDLLRQGRSNDPQLNSRLPFQHRFGSLAAKAARDAAWRFDDLSDVLAEEGERALEQERLSEARRARFNLEAVRALFWVDSAYEPVIIEWLENLPQQDINRLAQLLQVAGFDQVNGETLVREGVPLLHQPLVFGARLYQRLESVTVGGETKRELNPERFASKEVFQQAQGFYEQLFVVDRKGRFEFALSPQVDEFIRSQSALVRELTQSHLDPLLGDLVAEELE